MNGSFERRRENVFRDSYDAAAETQRESKSQKERREGNIEQGFGSLLQV